MGNLKMENAQSRGSNRSYDMPENIGGNSVQKVALALAVKDEN